MLRESCLRGQVAFELTRNVAPPSARHCRQKSGRHWASANAADKGDYHDIIDGLPQRPQ